MADGRTGEPQADQRLTVAQAAVRLGITEGAVRSRIKRGTLETVREGGSVYVLWGGGAPPTHQSTNTSVPSDQSELLAALRDQIEDLRRERDEWREQARVADRLLSAALERIPPQLEAPTDSAPGAPQAPERGEEQQGGGTTPHPDATGPQTAAQPRPWWRRFIGG